MVSAPIDFDGEIPWRRTASLHRSRNKERLRSRRSARPGGGGGVVVPLFRIAPAEGPDKGYSR